MLGERGERKAGRRGRKREQQEEEDEALLSKAQLQSALRAPGAVALLRDNAARLSALPALPLRPPTLSLVIARCSSFLWLLV